MCSFLPKTLGAWTWGTVLHSTSQLQLLTLPVLCFSPVSVHEWNRKPGWSDLHNEVWAAELFCSLWSCPKLPELMQEGNCFISYLYMGAQVLGYSQVWLCTESFVTRHWKGLCLLPNSCCRDTVVRWGQFRGGGGWLSESNIGQVNWSIPGLEILAHIHIAKTACSVSHHRQRDNALPLSVQLLPEQSINESENTIIFLSQSEDTPSGRSRSLQFPFFSTQWQIYISMYLECQTWARPLD